MNQSQAKKDACWHAALILQNTIDCGWEYDTKYTSPDDLARFEKALAELIAELFRRGGER